MNCLSTNTKKIKSYSSKNKKGKKRNYFIVITNSRCFGLFTNIEIFFNIQQLTNKQFIVRKLIL